MPRDFRAVKWSLLLLPLAGLGAWLVFASSRSELSRVGSVVKTPANSTTISKVLLPSAPAVYRNKAKVALPANAKTDTPAMPRELLVKFRSAAELQAFLAAVRKLGGRVLAVIPRLGAARIAFDTEAQGQAIRDLVPATASAGLNFLVFTPTQPDPQTDPGGPYLGFGHEALTWLGVPADNAQWGRGIKVAVLDTGVYAVPGLEGVHQIDLIGSSSGEMQDHGTAVASIISGTAADARGVAPGAELLSIRVLDSTGTGDSFTVAQGVLDAVDGGARVISMSIGSAGDSDVLHEAVDYALSRNVAVVAAVGNEGVGTVSYPAQYPGVIGVTAVDANGQRGGFANYGPEVTLAAPGIGVVTPWVDQQEVNFSGTSAAVPFVSGTLAMLFSENPNLTSTQATQLMVSYADDAGAPGTDPLYGAGILDVNRVLSRNQPGINDAAAADFYYDPNALNTSTNGMPVQVTVQNRGTTALSSVTLDVTNNGQSQRYFLSGLSAGSVQSQTILIDSNTLLNGNGVSLQSRVQLNGVRDVNATNDSRAITLRLKAP